MKKAQLICLCILISIPAFPQDWKTYPYSPPGSRISFPADEGRHPSEPEEWWYTAGHLTGLTSGNHYSFMLTYFYHPDFGFDGFRILNLANDDAGLFFSETLPVTYSNLATNRLEIKATKFPSGTESWQNKKDGNGDPLPFQYIISAASGKGTLNLEYNALKAPLIVADSGFLYQGDSHYTYYYSLTSNEVSGSVSINGTTENVIGTAWIDRQYGTINPYSGNQYEWLSVQLSNGMDLNIWNIFTADDRIPEGEKYRILAAYVNETTQFTTTDFTLERLKFAFMNDGKACYSQEWRLTSARNNIDILITTIHAGNEVQLPFRFYEGATTVSGTVNGTEVTGTGFAELLHSYSQPELTMANEQDWSPSTPLKWRIINPDDGNPLLFDLEYSKDNLNFLPVASGISDSIYYWNDPPLGMGETFWIKLTAYSTDKTLSNTVVTQFMVAEGNGLEEGGAEALVRLYPNPSRGEVIIEGEGIQIVKIYDIHGKTILALENNRHMQTISSGNLPKGYYFVRIVTNNGAMVRPVIIE